MDILDKYLQKSKELMEQGKTGRECKYCNRTETTTNSHGTFCVGCGNQKREEYGQCFGVPIYELEDWVELLRDQRITDYRLPLRSRE